MINRKKLISLFLLCALLLAACGPSIFPTAAPLPMSCSEKYDTMLNGINNADNSVVNYNETQELLEVIITALAEKSDSDDLTYDKMVDYAIDPIVFREIPVSTGDQGCSQDGQDKYLNTAQDALSVGMQYLTEAQKLNTISRHVNELLDDPVPTFNSFQKAVNAAIEEHIEQQKLEDQQNQ